MKSDATSFNSLFLLLKFKYDALRRETIVGKSSASMPSEPLTTLASGKKTKQKPNLYTHLGRDASWM
jgi:hypothetical protein